MSANFFGAQSQTPQPFSEEYVSSLFQTPVFLNQLDSYLATGKQAANVDDDIFYKEDENDAEY
ncbi:hypothetical protein Hanom_Chr11g01044071 [Helianthus anomalus]